MSEIGNIISAAASKHGGRNGRTNRAETPVRQQKETSKRQNRKHGHARNERSDIATSSGASKEKRRKSGTVIHSFPKVRHFCHVDTLDNKYVNFDKLSENENEYVHEK